MKVKLSEVLPKGRPQFHNKSFFDETTLTTVVHTTPKDDLTGFNELIKTLNQKIFNKQGRTPNVLVTPRTPDENTIEITVKGKIGDLVRNIEVGDPRVAMKLLEQLEGATPTHLR